MAKSKTPKEAGPVINLNPFDLPDYPPSPQRRSAKLSDKTHIRALAKALIRKS